MPAKKDKKKKQTKSRKVTRKRTAPKKKVMKKSSAKAARAKKAAAKKRRLRGKSENLASVEFQSEGLTARSGGQSGDLQGLSSRAGADSESVCELLEEGNAFEAEAVKGVQDAPDADEGEVTTHEDLEDDVPREYTD